jgi:aspartokinase-like uncharacterized kinase
MSSATPSSCIQPAATRIDDDTALAPRRGVLKIGGATLFTTPSWPERIASFQHQVDQLFVLVGGGDTVESMRRACELYPTLDPVAMHWRCVQLLDATWEVACELLPKATPISDWNGLQSALKPTRSALFLVRVGAYYHSASHTTIPKHWLPHHGWETTTDALGWLLCKLTGAQRLWLIKHCDCESIATLQEAAQQGIIDPELARLAAQDNGSNSVEILFVRG